MKLGRKKIIAREFLTLISCVLISIVAYIGTFPYNNIIRSKIKKIESKIQNLDYQSDSLIKPYKQKIKKQEWFYNEFIRLATYKVYEKYDEVWQRLSKLQKSDSIIYKWENVWSKDLIRITKEIGFKNGKEFNQFIIDYSFNEKDYEIQNKVASLNNQIEIYLKIKPTRNLILTSSEQLQFGLYCLVIFSIIVFPLRYLIYSIKWSIKTLKQK